MLYIVLNIIVLYQYYIGKNLYNYSYDDEDDDDDCYHVLMYDDDGNDVCFCLYFYDDEIT